MCIRLLLVVIIKVLLFTDVLAQSTDNIIIDHVNVIPMTHEVVLQDQRVLLAEGKIARIEDGNQPNRDTVSRRIDGRGKYLIPGLSEMHFHFRSNDIASDIKLLLANGITTVRNMAASPQHQHILFCEQTRSGILPKINYYTTGPYLTSRDVNSIEQVAGIVKMHKDSGYDFLKLADNLPLDVYLELLRQCQEHKVPIVGHSQRNQPVEYSLRMKAIEHVEEFLYLSDSAGHPSFFKQGKAATGKLVAEVKNSGVYIGTTLSVFQFINDCLTDSSFRRLQRHPHTRYLARDQRDGFLTEKNDYRKLRKAVFDGVPAPELFSSYFTWMKKLVKQFDNAGVPLITGSDTYGMVIVGFSLHEEFRLLQETGIKPFRILEASTVVPARFLDQYASEGTITPGKNANLVLLGGNPLLDIRNTSRIEGVFLRGEWLNRAALDKMLKEVEEAFK